MGSSDGVCRSRPFAVTGRGCLRNAGEGQLSLAQAFAATSGGGTFVLDASAGATNSFSLIRDGEAGGSLNVEKTGAGVWALDGTNTFSGSLAVKEGTRLVRNLPCSWFRFTVMETLYGQKKRLDETAPNDANTEIQEVALYDADGVRRNVNMAFHTTYDNLTSLPAGHACWTRTDSINYYNDRNGDKMFDDVGTGNGCCIVYARSGATLVVRLDTPSSWIPVVMHLDPQGAPITAFDVLTKAGTGNGRTPVAYKFDVSNDGRDWRTVYTETNTPAASAGRWMSNPSESFTAGAVRPGKGFSIANQPMPADEMLPNVSDVSVASNAVLEALGDVELKTLSVDASGAGNGTVKGFSFATAGTLRVTGLGATAGRCEIPIALEGCTGLENVSKWTLLFNGVPAANYCAKATPEGIILMENGTLLIVR